MTFQELQDHALDALGYATTSSAQVEARTRIKRWINDWHRRLLTRPGFARLLRDFEEPLTTTANQAIYGFAEPMGRLNGIYDTTNRWPLRLRDLGWLRQQLSPTAQTGTPVAYVPRGWAPVATQPSTADSIWAVAASGTATDQLAWDFAIQSTGAITRIHGVTTLTSTTPVQLGTSSVVTQILGLTYQGTNTTTLRIHQSSGSGAVLGYIQPGRSKARYFQVQLWPTPSAMLPYTCDFTSEIIDMAADQDEPMLPPDFHYVLSKGAQYEELIRRDDNRAGFVLSDLNTGIASLNRWLWDLPSPPTRDKGLPSRLGSWFPMNT